jgi:hypothetical protein
MIRKTFIVIGLSAALAGAISGQTIACEMPASMGPESLYGHTSSTSGIDMLNPTFRNNVANMMAAASRELGGEVQIYSGYRSVEHQARLYESALARYGSEAEARRWVAPPGNSMHNFGLAVDLRYNGQRIEYGSEISNWMEQNLERFGLERPLSNEGWHVEPLGGRANRDAILAGNMSAANPADCEFMNDSFELPPMPLMPWNDRA